MNLKIIKSRSCISILLFLKNSISSLLKTLKINGNRKERKEKLKGNVKEIKKKRLRLSLEKKIRFGRVNREKLKWTLREKKEKRINGLLWIKNYRKKLRDCMEKSISFNKIVKPNLIRLRTQLLLEEDPRGNWLESWKDRREICRLWRGWRLTKLRRNMSWKCWDLIIWLKNYRMSYRRKKLITKNYRMSSRRYLLNTRISRR